MYKDLISYELAENITKEHLLKVAQQVYNGWMKNQSGFIKWEICQTPEGGFTDVVHWESKEAADKATNEMANIPNGGDWFACYKEGTISSQKLSVFAEF